MKRLLLAIPLFALMGAGCVAPSLSQTCTLDAAFGLSLTIYDQTGAPVTGATITTQPDSGPFFELGGGQYNGITEGQGQYIFTISKPGFQPYVDTVVLTKGTCHVNGQTKTITLTPAK